MAGEKKIEKIVPDDSEIFDNEIDAFLNVFCKENKIEDMAKEPQSRWNACLMFIYKNVFKGTDKLKLKGKLEGYNNINNHLNNSNCGAYNIKKVNEICDYYIYLCNMYDKEISIMGFCKLTGIEHCTINFWGAGNRKLLSTAGKEIYEKLVTEREESLSNKLATGNKNPVGILAILNRHYAWNLPGVSREQVQKQQLTAEDIKQQLLQQKQPGNSLELSDSNMDSGP